MSELEILRSEIEALKKEIEAQKNTIIALEEENRELKSDLEREQYRCMVCHDYGEFFGRFLLCSYCYEKDKDYYVSHA